ncbi:MAG TPA: hypothetical protein VL979_09205 [Solirubrobacteraceae bacterium]|nr:hypothetical protein [Solirubrobacteraceae bacterium]
MSEQRGMRSVRVGRRLLVAACALVVVALAAAPAATAARGRRERPVTVKRTMMRVRESRAQAKAETVTLPQLGRVAFDRVGVIKIRRKGEPAPNVLVLEPGTSAAAAYFVPFAKSLVQALPHWQVWAVERRENLLENQTELTKYKFGELSEQENPVTKEEESPSQQFFNYYLGYLGKDEVKAEEEVFLKYVLTGRLEKEVTEKYLSEILTEVLQKDSETGKIKKEVEAKQSEIDEQASAKAHKELEEAKITEEQLEKRTGEDAEAIAAADGEAIFQSDVAALAVVYGERLAKQIGEQIFDELVASEHDHYEPVPEALVPFAKQWGMARAVEDLNVVIEAAKRTGGKVVLGGHSLGGSVVTAYATWDFAGKPGAEGLSGLVYDDGGSSPQAISAEEAQHELAKLDEPGETPWLAFGGIPAPDLGLFSIEGSTLTTVEPEGRSLLESFPLLPADLRGPITPVTNEAGFGYSVNVGTSPESLIAAQIHGGQGVSETASEDGLHAWDGAGALTPVKRYAEMLSGTGVREANGSEWYFPARLTLDTGAVGNGLANPAQEVLGLHATMGEHLPSSLHILAIDSELDALLGGGQTTLNEAEALAAQSGIPPSNLTLIEEKSTYAHNDPAGATPEINEFFEHMVPFLEQVEAE